MNKEQTKTLEEQIEANQKTIVNLVESLKLWENTSVPSETRALVADIQARMLFTIRLIEIQGQEVKIDYMTKALALLKGENNHA